MHTKFLFSTTLAQLAGVLPSPSRIRVTNIFRACVISDTLSCRFLRSRAGEHFEETTPVAFSVKDAKHLITTCPATVKMSMLQLNTLPSLPSGMKRTSISVLRVVAWTS